VHVLKERPMVLVGASLGGAAAVDFAHTYPEAVEKLVLIDAQVRSPPVRDLVQDPALAIPSVAPSLFPFFPPSLPPSLPPAGLHRRRGPHGLVPASPRRARHPSPAVQSPPVVRRHPLLPRRALVFHPRRHAHRALAHPPGRLGRGQCPLHA
jgi:pimeloyl-ACP methyl ester carboxylesterase